MSEANKSNPITVAVVRNAVNAYADEMAHALCKSAYNMMIYEVRDFCCGLIDREARMISQNKGGLPIFLADLGIAVKDGIERYGLDGFAPGDIVIMNHGRVCGQHLNNIVIYAPCFHDGELVAFAASRAHWVDIGGMRVGFGSVETTEIYQEGLQFRSLKIYEAGKRNETLWQVIHDNVRFPEAALGDLRAQIASCQLGIRRFSELVKRYGPETVERCIHAIWDQTEREARTFIEKVPDGVYEAESFLDNDGRTLDKRLRIKVKVTIDGDRMIVDFSDINDQVPGPTNSGYSGGLAAARIAYKCLTQPRAPVNEGCFRPLELILPEGKLLNAKAPAALGLWSIPLPTVIDTILKALAPALPERIPAGHKGDMGGCSIGGFRADGRRFLLMNIFGGGWGGRPHEDGESASVSICQGDVRSAPVELQEIQYPFLIERYELRADSGGAGRHRGGLGVELTYRALQKAVTNVNCERTKDPPWGLHGGKPGAVNEALLVRRDGSEERLLKATGVPMEPGDRLTFRTAGGGGWGDPRGRDPAALADDIAKGYVSREAARRDYGMEPPC
ncbi:MAG TPA: hydantoinase B/oxoprolinase family protein [Xanthobacteraceae bacterium]|nr:hydantoinase B/oxoprolinase family protein [Xanthobacteraceae bacterium]